MLVYSHYHVIAVLLPDGELPTHPPDELFPFFDSSFVTYDELIDNDDYTAPTAYIVGEFSQDDFPEDSLYIIGDESAEQPDDGGYNNGPLKYGSSFTFFLRAYPKVIIMPNNV